MAEIGQFYIELNYINFKYFFLQEPLIHNGYYSTATIKLKGNIQMH